MSELEELFGVLDKEESCTWGSWFSVASSNQKGSIRFCLPAACLWSELYLSGDFISSNRVSTNSLDGSSE